MVTITATVKNQDTGSTETRTFSATTKVAAMNLALEWVNTFEAWITVDYELS
jgi:hypothetical protein